MSARVTIEQLESFCVEALKACDVGEENARATAQLLAFTDSWGVFTHGSKLLIGYAKRLTGKGLKGNATPSVVREGPSWALVDGDSTLGQVTSTYAMQLAIDKAKEAGSKDIEIVRHEVMSQSFVPRATLSWNNLPVNIRMANNVNAFKLSVKQWIRDNISIA